MVKPGEGKIFMDENPTRLTYDNHVITLHSKIKVRKTLTNADGTTESQIVNNKQL